ncbi:MAG: DUF3990 domain-containing protein [Clostridia bacterium]|nr:DUF3990 domain-containing protein [Clostridia bacterium]
MAQQQLYSFCEKHNVDIADVIVDKYRYEHDDDRLILYHGSKQGLVGDIQPKSRKDCDFGCGFYTGTDTIQPLTLVCGEPNPKFYVVDLDLSGLKTLDMELGLEWAMVVAYHRGYMDIIKGTEMYEKYAHFLDGYDMVIGYIANDRLYTELTRFFNGDITDVALMHCLVALDLGKQYVAKTQKGCDAFKIVTESDIYQMELLALREKSVIRRKESYAIASEIEKKFRREGKYFDEILRGE